jgi:glycosyltransferase involved in cell wall biosynthesis
MREKILFVRDVRRPTGGNIKVRDYFFHALSHPDLDARIWFPPQSRHAESDIWAELPPDRVASRCDFDAYRFVCVNGKDWRLLTEASGPIIHFVQHGGYATDPELQGYLRRPAHRLCTSAIVRDAVLPYANGPTAVVPLGIDDACFAVRTAPDTVLILGRKQPNQARALHARLAAQGVTADLLLDDWLPRAEFLRRIGEADILVTLPSAVEGFFLPPLEGMAAGCAVICSAAVGNREHCIAGETCLQPPFGDVEAHAAALLRLLADGELRAKLRRNGMERAARHRMAAERAGFHAFISEAIASS